jgi:hypothetical protein
MRLTMLGEAGTRVFKGVCPATPADIYNPVILVRRRARRTTFVALHDPTATGLDLQCLVNNEGTLLCQVSGEGLGPDLLFKQDEERAVNVGGHIWRGKLAYCGLSGDHGPQKGEGHP